MSQQPPQVPKDDLPPLAAALVDKPVWVRLLVLIPMISVMLGFLLGFPGYFVWKALSYQPATATVGDCHGPPRASCQATWVTEDGERGSGTVEGSGLEEGAKVDVWAAGGTATTSPPWAWWIIPGVFGFGFAIAGVVIVKAIRESRRGTRSGARLVTEWSPPAEFPPRGVAALYAAPEVRIDWQTKGIAGEARYEFSATERGVLAQAGEPDLSTARKVWRFVDELPGEQARRLACTDQNGNLLFTVDKPANRLDPVRYVDVTVLGPTGTKVGLLSQVSRNPFRRRFECHDASGQLLARLAQPSWSSQSFLVTDRYGTEVARLVHGLDRRPGHAASVQRYILQLRHQPQEPLHTLLLAAVPCVNLLVAAA